MNKIFMFLIEVVISIAALSDSFAAEEKHSSFSGLTDDLVHYVNFAQDPPPQGIQTILTAMNKAGVRDIMISGQPVIKRWAASDLIRPIYYLDNDSTVYPYALTDIIVARAVMSLPLSQRYRFHPFISGFDPTDRNAVNQIKLLIKWYPNFWQGIGQINTRHGLLSHLSTGELAKANSEALYPVYDLAAKYHLPIIIQSNISTTWVAMDSITAKSPLYLAEMTGALRTHPKTIFIWAHAGLDRDINVTDLPKILRKVLSQYPNLYIDISGLAYPYIVNNNIPNPAWIRLIKKFPDRFIFGTDSFQQFDQYPDRVKKYQILFDTLPPNVAEKVFKTNFLSLLTSTTKGEYN